MSQIQPHILSRCIKPVISISTRGFQPKKHPYADDRYFAEVARRFGYEAHHHTRGALPRLKLKEKKLGTMPITVKEDRWSTRNARMGENDYIKIFGDDENIEQHDLLTNVPDWLRGYKNTDREYSVLMRKRKEFEHWKYTKPLKWLHLEQRIKFLYRRINNKYMPPDVEKLARSRYD